MLLCPSRSLPDPCIILRAVCSETRAVTSAQRTTRPTRTCFPPPNEALSCADLLYSAPAATLVALSVLLCLPRIGRGCTAGNTAGGGGDGGGGGGGGGDGGSPLACEGATKEAKDKFCASKKEGSICSAKNKCACPTGGCEAAETKPAAEEATEMSEKDSLDGADKLSASLAAVCVVVALQLTM